MTGAPYYDPYDFAIDADPYPVWARLRDTAPLYYNEKYDFYALSRFDDVDRALTDWQTYISGEGFILEMIKTGVTMPPGSLLGEDPPAHDVHRGLLSRVFTPRRMAALEPQVRSLCRGLLDRYVGAGGFDVVADLGAVVPMRVIGLLLGIPEQDQEAIRDAGNERLRLAEGAAPEQDDLMATARFYGEYIDWRADHPSDDLMTELLRAEFTDETGVTRRLTRTEVLTYTAVLAGAGNETVRRLVGWTGQLLAAHPDQRRALAADRSLVPAAIEEILRYESPSPVQGRVTTRDVEHHGRTVPAGSAMLLLNSAGNRDGRHFADPDSFDVRRPIDRHLAFGRGPHFCLGAALARLEGRVVLDELLRRWTDWEVDTAGAVLDHTSTTRGWRALPIVTAQP